MSFRCIYCKEVEPDVEPSESHIIPLALGKGPVLNGGVCKICNNRINSEVEEPIIRALAPLRNMLQLEGRREEAVRFEATVSFMEFSQRIYLTTPKALDNRLFVFVKEVGPGSKKRISIIGATDKIEEVRRRYESKHPNTEWSQIQPADIGDSMQIRIEIDVGIFASQLSLRLAAKIAFEYYCLNRSPEVVLGWDFDDVRGFILNGTVTSGRDTPMIVLDPAIVTGLAIPFPFHSIYEDQRMSAKTIISIVGLFGLMQYEVILSHFGGGLAANQAITLVHLQTGELYSPPLFRKVTPPDVHQRIALNRRDPSDALEILYDRMLTRLNGGYKQLLEGSKSE